jgi:hypothetical protein
LLRDQLCRDCLHNWSRKTRDRPPRQRHDCVAAVSGPVKVSGGWPLRWGSWFAALLDRATGAIDARDTLGDMVDEVAADMAREYGLPPRWLNRNAAAFLPDEARWIAGPEGTSSAVKLADLPTLAAMKMPAERTNDIEDLGHIVLALGLKQSDELMRLAYAKYGEHSVALGAPADNYEIFAEEAMAAAKALLLRQPAAGPAATQPE